MRKIKISQLKNIGNLDFEIPNPGVYALTGPNGSGKTTLLASLHRIGFPNAFAEHFKTTPSKVKVDSFGGASIAYHIDEKSVQYKYTRTRWVPYPKSAGNLLDSFGFASVKFIAANAKRIEPFATDLIANKIRNPSDSIVSNVKKILMNEKYSNLKVVKTRGGRGVQAYLIQQTIAGKKIFFSEKNFSLGEFCIIKLVDSLTNIEFNSLVLIDEIEMALYPKAQIKLLEFLQSIAISRHLTIIVSTHSATLIKRIKRKQILYLRNDGDGNIRCKKGCYPAEVLGETSIIDEVHPDFIFFCEDQNGKYLFGEMIEYYKTKITLEIPFPQIRIVPVGPYDAVVSFLTNSDQIFPDSVMRFAYLDKDVWTESLAKLESDRNYVQLQKFRACEDRIKYLPSTPEEGVVNLINSDQAQHGRELNRLISDRQFDLIEIVSSPVYSNFTGDNPRKVSKLKLAHIVSEANRRTGKSQESLLKLFYSYFTRVTFADGIKDIRTELGPIFNREPIA